MIICCRAAITTRLKINMGPCKTDKRINSLQKKDGLQNILCQCLTERIQPEEIEKLGSKAKFIFSFTLVINTDLNEYQIQATRKTIVFLLKKRLCSGLLPNRGCWAESVGHFCLVGHYEMPNFKNHRPSNEYKILIPWL